MSQHSTPGFSIRNVIFFSFVLALPVAAYFWWDYRYWKNYAVPVDYVKMLTGHLKRQPADKLAARFKDETGDLVAEGPADPADLMDPAEIVFSPGGFPEANETTWKPLMDHLAKATGKPVSFRNYEDPRQLLESLADGKVHFTSFNTGFVPTAVNLGGFVPVAALAPADGTTSYSMEIIVPIKSTVKSLSDLNGGKLMLTSPGSHSGFKAPLIVLRDVFGFQPGVNFEFVISGGHDQSIKAIARGSNVAAPVASDLLADAVAKGKVIQKDQFRSIYKSKPFPKGAWGYSCRLNPSLAAELREAILNFDLNNSPLAEQFKGSGAVKFAPVDYKKDWAYVREIDEKMLNW